MQLKILSLLVNKAQLVNSLFLQVHLQATAWHWLYKTYKTSFSKQASADNYYNKDKDYNIDKRKNL